MSKELVHPTSTAPLEHNAAPASQTQGERVRGDTESKAETINAREPSLHSTSTGPLQQGDGVTKIEALYIVFGKGFNLWLLWGSIGLIAFVYSLQASTTGAYLQFATSTFSRHSLLATIATINWIVSAVNKPIFAKISDMSSRPTALTVSLVFYCVGYILVAASKKVEDVAGGEVLYTIGNDGLNFVKALIIADITNLQNRGIVNALVTSPYIPNGFIAGYISQGINAFSNDNWRWGYGMFIIMTPILIMPAIGVLYWGQWRARRLGALAAADAGFAQRQVVEGLDTRTHWTSSFTTMRQTAVGTTKQILTGRYFKRESFQAFGRTLVNVFWQVDIIGLVLLGFALGLFLVPFSIAASADGGFANPSMIAMLVVGFVLFFVFGTYEIKWAPYPLMPKRVLNRSLIASCVINFFYFMSYYISGTYQSSWVYIVRPDWSTRDYTFWTNTMNTGLCVFALVAGLVQRYTHQYKWSMIFGLGMRMVGNGLAVAATRNPSDALLVMSPVIVSIGTGFFTIGANLAAQASVPHADLAIASAILYLVTSIGGACGGAAAGAIWTNKLVPALSSIPSSTSPSLPAFNATEIATIYGSIVEARARPQVYGAYLDTAWYLEVVCLCLSAIPFIAGWFAKDFYLGTAHNAIESKEVIMRGQGETTDEKIQERAREAEERARARLEVKGQMPGTAGMAPATLT